VSASGGNKKRTSLMKLTISCRCMSGSLANWWQRTSHIAGVILWSGPLRFAGTVAVPNRSYVNRILRTARGVQGTIPAIFLFENPWIIIEMICSWESVSRGAMRNLEPVLACCRIARERAAVEFGDGGPGVLGTSGPVISMSHTCWSPKPGSC